MPETIFAYTSPGSNYPEYVNLSRNDDGVITLTVRGNIKPDGTCGDTVAISLPKKEMADLGKAIINDVIAE